MENHVSFLKMPDQTTFTLDGLNIGQNLFLIAGPRVIESEAHALKMAEAISTIARGMNYREFFQRMSHLS